MNEDKVKKIIQEMFSRNYTAGNTKVPPHTHNTIDNLPVSYKSLTDKPTIPTVGDILSKIPAPSGGGGSLEVTDSITDVTGVTKMDFPAGSLTEISPTEVSISVSATPAGSDTQIQYNSGGSAFGASSNFTYAQHFSFITATYTVVIGATNFSIYGDSERTAPTSCIINALSSGVYLRYLLLAVKQTFKKA